MNQPANNKYCIRSAFISVLQKPGYLSQIGTFIFWVILLQLLHFWYTQDHVMIQESLVHSDISRKFSSQAADDGKVSMCPNCPPLQHVTCHKCYLFHMDIINICQSRHFVPETLNQGLDSKSKTAHLQWSAFQKLSIDHVNSNIDITFNMLR